MADISPAATGLITGAGVLVSATVGLAMKMFVMSDHKDTVNYDRVKADLVEERNARRAEVAELHAKIDRLTEQNNELRDQLAEAKREIAMWRENRGTT